MKNSIAVAESELNDIRALLLQCREELREELDFGV